MNNTDGQIVVFKRMLSPLSQLAFGRYVRVEKSCAREQGVSGRWRLLSEEPCTGQGRRCLRSVSKNTHKLLFCKELCRISLLQPTGTESALPLLDRMMKANADFPCN